MILILVRNQKNESTIQTPIVINYLDNIFYLDPITKEETKISKNEYNQIDLRCDDGSILKKIK